MAPWSLDLIPRFLKENVYKNPASHTEYKNWNTMFGYVFQASLQRLITGLLQTWSKAWKHAFLIVVDIPNA
jgi:hypothetical protein